MRDFHDVQRELLHSKLAGRPEPRTRPFESVQEAGLLQTDEASIRVVLADPEHLRDLVDRSEVSVLLQILRMSVGALFARPGRDRSIISSNGPDVKTSLFASVFPPADTTSVRKFARDLSMIRRSSSKAASTSRE